MYLEFHMTISCKISLFLSLSVITFFGYKKYDRRSYRESNPSRWIQSPECANHYTIEPWFIGIHLFNTHEERNIDKF